MNKDIREVSTEQFKAILDKISSEFLSNKFKLSDNCREKYEGYIAKLKAACENLKKNGQASKKEEDFLENTRKIFNVLENNSDPVGKEKLGQAVEASNSYLYALLLNMEKQEIIEKV